MSSFSLTGRRTVGMGNYAGAASLLRMLHIIELDAEPQVQTFIGNL